MTAHPDLFGHEAEEPDRWAALFSSASDEWPTDQAVFDDLHRRFGPFMLDAAATAANRKCAIFFGPGSPLGEDGLVVDWTPIAAGKGAVFVNPPYTRGVVEAWVAKAIEESARGVRVVLLLPSRTDTVWFHLLLAHQDRVRFFFARGRLRFGDAKTGAPFPSVVVVLDQPTEKQPAPRPLSAIEEMGDVPEDIWRPAAKEQEEIQASVTRRYDELVALALARKAAPPKQEQRSKPEQPTRNPAANPEQLTVVCGRALLRTARRCALVGGHAGPCSPEAPGAAA